MVASVMIVTPDIDQRLDCGATAAWAAGAVRRSIGLGDACDATRVERAGRGACVRRQRGPCARVPETDMRTLSSVFLESSPGSLSRLRKRNIFTLGSAVRQVQVHSYGCGCDIPDIAARKSSSHGVVEGGGGRRLLPGRRRVELDAALRREPADPCRCVLHRMWARRHRRTRAWGAPTAPGAHARTPAAAACGPSEKKNWGERRRQRAPVIFARRPQGLPRDGRETMTYYSMHAY